MRVTRDNGQDGSKRRGWVIGACGAALALLFSSVSLMAQTTGKLIPGDGAAGDQAGRAVAVSGNTALVGAALDGDKGLQSGSVYVFTVVSGVWTQSFKLTAADGAVGDQFGWSLAIDGDTAIVGAPQDDDRGNSSGGAYVFTRADGVWTQQAKLVASDGAANDNFGYAVSVDGDTAVVGAHFDAGGGSAYVFTRVGGVWTQQAQLLAADRASGDTFGKALAISGDTVVVAAVQDQDLGFASGSAYVFTRAGGVWSQQAKLNAPGGVTNDLFGTSVSIDGDVIAVGMRGDDDRGTDSGSAFVFRRTGAVWTMEAKLLALDGAAGDDFGGSVSIKGDALVVGAYSDDDGASASGSVYVFTRVDGVWSQLVKLNAADGAANDLYGFSVAMSGANVVVGAFQDDEQGANSGVAHGYTFAVASTDDDNDGVLNETDLCPTTPAGSRVSIFGCAFYDLVGPQGAAGAPGAPGETGAAGAVGATGPMGPAGPVGPMGPMGPEGPAGPVGPTGATGADGAPGAMGAVGPTGPAGAAGAMGPAGPAGPRGAKGAKGDRGPAGPTGATGAVPGSLLYLIEGVDPPAGFERIGSFRQELTESKAGRNDKDRKSTIVIVVYVKR